MKLARSAYSGVLKFGLVGMVATVVHSGTYLLLAGPARLNPVWANVTGFLIAFVISYLGHSEWTFADHGVGRRRSMVRFLVLSLASQLVNFSWTWVMVVRLRFPDSVGLIGIGILIPAISFLGNRYWVFRASASARASRSPP